MIRTKIDWADYTWNPVTGCNFGCKYCYANKIASRFKGTKAFPNGFEPTFHAERLSEPFGVKHPSIIFVCSMGELFGDWIGTNWGNAIFDQIRTFNRIGIKHTYIFLTKQPQNLRNFSPFPDNCWVGISVTDNQLWNTAIRNLDTFEAKLKFMSFEPLLSAAWNITDNNHTDLYSNFIKHKVGWVIIGAQTCPTITANPKYIKEIVNSANMAGIPIFMKNNLLNLGREIGKIGQNQYMLEFGIPFVQQLPEGYKKFKIRKTHIEKTKFYKEYGFEPEVKNGLDVNINFRHDIRNMSW
jgi:protein gp37